MFTENRTILCGLHSHGALSFQWLFLLKNLGFGVMLGTSWLKKTLLVPCLDFWWDLKNIVSELFARNSLVSFWSCNASLLKRRCLEGITSNKVDEEFWIIRNLTVVLLFRRARDGVILLKVWEIHHHSSSFGVRSNCTLRLVNEHISKRSHNLSHEGHSLLLSQRKWQLEIKEIPGDIVFNMQHVWFVFVI